MVFTSLCIAFGMNVKIASHIAGVKNERCDELSRVTSSGKSVASIMEKYKLTNAPEVYIWFTMTPQSLFNRFHAAKSVASIWIVLYVFEQTSVRLEQYVSSTI